MSETIAAWQDNILCPFDKLEVHKRGLKHPAVSVFIKRENDILLQKRAATKYHSPNLWANTVCTHPHWGENLYDCAIRRLDEELNIKSLDLKFCKEIEYKANVGNNLIEHEVVSVFIAEISKNFNLQIQPNPNEVMSTKWINIISVLQEIDQFPKSFTEWFKIYMKKYSMEILG
ncbi:MAG: isopentenyl-diphosphate delta-isomerase [Actinomycetales bacterium]|nr:MAG: isopentenyl-diphosphate delta-isomerase [Actinomycetales bacterium]